MADLKHIDLPTEEDRRHKIDQWARLFKATTWEVLKMLSESDSIWAEDGETILKISADEHMRQLLEAREDCHRRQIDAQTLYNKAIKERDDAEMERAKQKKNGLKQKRNAITLPPSWTLPWRASPNWKSNSQTNRAVFPIVPPCPCPFLGYHSSLDRR
ncbi:MAG: hypothetical protein IJJ13_07990 [Lachnospiraceae bacterium]|nr:hypothetical protein [Lachnospiraceae bacterium]